MLRKYIGLLSLLLISGCTSNDNIPTYPDFVSETREEISRQLCNEYTWEQINRKWKTGNPSVTEVCLSLHLCALNSRCRLALPPWHYRRKIH